MGYLKLCPQKPIKSFSRYNPPNSSLTESLPKVTSRHNLIGLLTAKRAATLMKGKFERILSSTSTPIDKGVKEKFMGRNLMAGWREIAWSLTMQGVALIGAIQKAKHRLENFYVCEKLEDFGVKFNQILHSSTDIRCTMIVSSFSSDYTLPYRRSKDIPLWQHKIAIGIEKVGSKVRVVILDSSPEYSTLRKYGPNSAVIESMGISEADQENITIYCPTTAREKAYGCETFAMRDAVAFHETPDFFNEIELIDESTPPFFESILFPITEITALPPRFMIGTQSICQIEDYHKTSDKLARTPFSHRKKGRFVPGKPLGERVGENTVNGQNHYISFRSYKYHTQALQLLEQHSAEDLIEMISPVWLGSDLTK